MSRRNKTYDRHSKKGSNSTSRYKQYLNQKPVVILACEGSETERNYFTLFFEDLINEKKMSPRSYVFADHQHTNPSGVLQDLIDYKGKDGLTYKDFDDKWIVIDRDAEKTNGGGHSLDDYLDAISRSQRMGVLVAYSNPCFEIWYLLHFQFHNSGIDRNTLKHKLQQKMPDYKKGDKTHYIQLKKDIDQALKFAQKLDQNLPEIENCRKNPITTVYRLIKKYK